MNRTTEWFGVHLYGGVYQRGQKWIARCQNKDYKYYKSFDTKEEAYTDRHRFCLENNLYKNYYRIVDPETEQEYRELKLSHKNKHFIVKYDSNIQKFIESHIWNLWIPSTLTCMTVRSYTLENTLKTILHSELIRRPLTDLLDYRSSAFKQKDEYEPVPDYENLTYFLEDGKFVSQWFAVDKNKPVIIPLGNENYRVQPHSIKFQEYIQDFENFDTALEYTENFLIKNGFVQNPYRFVKNNDNDYYVEIKIYRKTKDHILLCEVEHLHILQKYTLISILDGKTYYCYACKDQKTYRFHRLAYPDYKMIDHIHTKSAVLDDLGNSMNGLDNRRSNIREVTQRQNCNNKHVNITSNTGHTGVYLIQNQGNPVIKAEWPVKKQGVSEASKYKSFSISKYGRDQALDCALATRTANYTLYLYEIGELK